MNEKKSMIIMIVAIVLVVLLGGAASYYMHFVMLKETQDELTQVQSALAEMQRKAREVDAKWTELAQAQVEYRQAMVRVPEQGDSPYDFFPRHIESLAQSAGVFIGNYNPITIRAEGGRRGGGRTGPENVRRGDWEINHEGGFYELLQFVHRLESDRFFIRVNTLSIAPAQQAGAETVEGSGPKGATLTITTYLYTGSPPSEEALTAQRPGAPAPETPGETQPDQGGE